MEAPNEPSQRMRPVYIQLPERPELLFRAKGGFTRKITD